jgi:hypothetical protein
MEALLKNIKAAIEKATSYFKARSVHIVPDLDFVPLKANYPCVLLKDGGVSHALNAGNTDYQTIMIDMAVYHRSKKDIALLMGDGTGPGILETGEVVKIMIDNNLAIDSRLTTVFIKKEQPTRLYTSGEYIAQRKDLRFQFEMSLMRPGDKKVRTLLEAGNRI